jgi:hypothetical protein
MNPIKEGLVRKGGQNAPSANTQRPSAPPPFRPTQSNDGYITLSVKLSNGQFDSSIQIPLESTAEEKQRLVVAWFNLMEAGIKCGQAARDTGV